MTTTSNDPIPKEEVEEYISKALNEYGLTLTYEEAEAMLKEVNNDGDARDRR